MMGGRSLSFTGEIIYGTSVMGPSADSPLARQLRVAIGDGPMALLVPPAGDGALFADVGGAQEWQRLCRELEMVQA